MSSQIILAMAAVALASVTPAAAELQCEGIITPAQIPGWTTIKPEATDEGCSFKTNSPLGHQILKVCPNGSTWVLERPVGRNSDTITKIDGVRRLR